MNPFKKILSSTHSRGQRKSAMRYFELVLKDASQMKRRMANIFIVDSEMGVVSTSEENRWETI